MKMLTVTEAARALEVTPALIRIYIRQGVFPGAVKVRGTRWKIPVAAVEMLDGVDVSGIFAKRDQVPFCTVSPDRDDGTWWQIRTKNDYLIDMFEDKKEAEKICSELNDAADRWAKNA